MFDEIIDVILDFPIYYGCIVIESVGWEIEL